MSKQKVSPDHPDENINSIETENLSVEELQQKLAEAEARAGEYWEKLLRTKAEQENLQRRHDREVENAHKYALERFAQELLPVIDSLEMGVEAANSEGVTVEKLREGTVLTLKMLLAAMEKFGIAAIHPQGEPFNPELHQAMSLLESPEHAPNTVMNVMQKGYTLNTRLIRPAMVVVSKAGKEKQE
ncbi:MAG: nucleotide exchange factor GrpE [Proteobacteria bacterium]|jgi:molecular chaperone GrpE|nr:nucleotide exchange factor GrpE [Pseudomonadota bacterium]